MPLKKNFIATVYVSRRGVEDKLLALYPGVLSTIPGSPSLSDETLSRDLVF